MNETVLRVRTLLRQKLLLSVVLTGGIFGAYLLLQRNTFFPTTVLQPTGIDRLMPFVPSAVYLYESIWLLFPVAPWLMTSEAELNRYTKGLVSISLVAFALFFFFPTAVPRPKGSQEFNYLYATLVQIDRASNALPSLHCAFAVFHGLCCQWVLSSGRWAGKIKWMVWFWVVGIVVSTLLTKQHILLDAAAGIALGIAGYSVFFRVGRVAPSSTSHSYSPD